MCNTRITDSMAADTTRFYTDYFSAQPSVLKKTREFWHKIHRDAQLTHVPSILLFARAEVALAMISIKRYHLGEK